jgi:addiction module HigA family antidote
MLPKNRITSHPGEVLAEEFMKPLGLSANALARALHVPPNRITAIVNGHRGVTGDTALRLGRYFGTSAEMWINLQAMHDLSRANVEAGAAIARDVKQRKAA